MSPRGSSGKARTSSTPRRSVPARDGRAGYLTSDLSYDYVRINADYRS